MKINNDEDLAVLIIEHVKYKDGQIYYFFYIPRLEKSYLSMYQLTQMQKEGEVIQRLYLHQGCKDKFVIIIIGVVDQASKHFKLEKFTKKVQ